jgi:threonine synthase
VEEVVTMPERFHLACVACGRTYRPGQVEGTCPSCGDRRGTLDVVYDLASGLKTTDLGVPGAGLFRFAPLLPLSPPDPRTPLHVGDTPLVEAPRIAARLGIARLWLKDEGRNPSASMKDRATAVALAHAAGAGRNVVVAASTGNAASSLATIAASMGLRAVIFVPATAPRPKVSQMLLAGATVVAVDGTYDQAFDLAAEAARRFGWYSRNTATNPYLAEGKKTCAIEVAQALAWEAPDLVAVGVGDGCVYAAQHKAFAELRAAGLTRALPRLVGVQAEGAAPLAAAFAAGRDATEPVATRTFADSISVGVPRDEVKALRAARESGGEILAVPDDAIRSAMRTLACEAGVFAEPAGAAGLAGLMAMAAAGRLQRSDRVVAIVSGHGLKDTEGAMSAATGSPIPIPPDPDALDRLATLA